MIEIEDGTPGASYLVQITRQPADMGPFNCRFTADQVIPTPVGVPAGAGGRGWFSFLAAQGDLSYIIDLSGLSSPELRTRLLTGAPGERGLVIATLARGRFKRGTVHLNEDAVEHLLAGNLFVNVHTRGHPHGEVRSQIMPVEPETESIAILRADSDGDARYEASGSGALPFDAVSVAELAGAEVEVFRLDGDRQVRVLSGVVPGVGGGDTPSGHSIRVDPIALLFGEVLTGEVRSLRLVIKNTGPKKLNVVAIELEEGTTPEFSIEEFDRVHLAPGASLRVRVSYAPTGAGFDEGTLIVRSDAQFANKVRVPLAGRGIGERAPNVEVEPRALAFGPVRIGSSRTLEATISNLGMSDLLVREIEVAPGTSPEFELEPVSLGAAVAPVTLSPGASISVPVVFRPVDPGESTGELVIASSDADEPLVEVSLGGTGVTTPDPEIDVSPVALVYDEVLVGTARTLAATVRNLGSADLEVGAVELGVGTSSDYSIVSQPGSFVLPPGASASVRVRYLPTETGFDSGTVRFSSNDSDEPLVTISLAGRGVTIEVPEIDVSPLALRFEEVFVGSSRTLDVTVANTGSASLEVTGIAFGAGSSADFALGRSIDGVSVAPGANFVLPVRFLPGGSGPAAATLLISSDDADEPTVTVALSGTGVVREMPALLVTPASVNFGARSIGSTSVRAVGIRNTGSMSLRILGIELRPFSSSAYSLVGEPGPVTLGVG
ncbi:MAG: choice-of-anchor D domain-containing protein, partial [Actinobacteria bacterium]|nr:choice-of-anchor D domain-containing protein [Actinomycetota bacterium]